MAIKYYMVIKNEIKCILWTKSLGIKRRVKLVNAGVDIIGEIENFNGEKYQRYAEKYNIISIDMLMEL